MTEIQKTSLQLQKLEVEKALARKSVYGLMQYKLKYYDMLPVLDSWFYGYLSEMLEAVRLRQIPRLGINMPPSYGKTELVVRSFAPYLLGRDPKHKIIYTNYDDGLSSKTSAQTRDFIRSDVYKGVFKIGIKKGFDEKTEWAVDGGGSFNATTVKGAITGSHAHTILIDDPLKQSEWASKAAKDFVWEYYTGSVLSRLQESVESPAAIVLIMQRLAQDDLSGRLLKEQGDLWKFVSLEALNAEHKIYKFGGFEYERAANEPLFVKKHDLAALDRKKREMGYQFDIQMQGDPKVSAAGFFDKEWWEEVSPASLPKMRCIITVDPASSESLSSDDRAIVVTGWFRNQKGVEFCVYLDGWYGKWTGDIFDEYLMDAMHAYPDADAFIEGEAAGILLGQRLTKKIAARNTELRAQGKRLIKNRWKVYKPNNQKSKVAKIADNIEPYARNGQCLYARGARGIDKLLSEAAAFSPQRVGNIDNMLDGYATAWDKSTSSIETQTAQREAQMRKDNAKQAKQNRGWEF